MRPFRLAALTAIATLAVGFCARAQDLPEGQGKAVVQTACLQCHGVDVVARQPRSADEWTEVVARMIGAGAQLTDDEYTEVMQYLTTHLGPSSQTPPSAVHPPATPPAAKHDK